MSLENETKIRFCNAHHALSEHSIRCVHCAEYLKLGDGDICNVGKDLIAVNFDLPIEEHDVEQERDQLKTQLAQMEAKCEALKAVIPNPDHVLHWDKDSYQKCLRQVSAYMYGM